MTSNGLMFKWEEGPALEHHCGVCKRPLSHPRARYICFGHHAEPCRRFHQALFMIGRSHQCMACISADEIHLKRHREISEILRLIYESNGLNISLIPPANGSPRRRRPRPTSDKDDEDSSHNHAKLTRKEKKEAKKATRAAQRPKVLTLAEITYVGDVLHPDHESDDDAEDPANADEIEEIERNLRYHAELYNNRQPRAVLREVVYLVDSEVDFEVEVDRIFEILRVNELLKKNTKNRGLTGKDLKNFEDLVQDLKVGIVEDLVQVKKEDLETRMRRGGYLRYTNRANYDIMLERQEIVDWATGEKIRDTDEAAEGHVDVSWADYTKEGEEDGTEYTFETEEDKSGFSSLLQEDESDIHWTPATRSPEFSPALFSSADIPADPALDSVAPVSPFCEAITTRARKARQVNAKLPKLKLPAAKFRPGTSKDKENIPPNDGDAKTETEVCNLSQFDASQTTLKKAYDKSENVNQPSRRPKDEPQLSTKFSSAPLREQDWKHFTKYMPVDSLIFILSPRSCAFYSYQQNCPWSVHDILDCPFHVSSPHVHPLDEMWDILFPQANPIRLSGGPFTRLEAERLESLFNKHSVTKGRATAVDASISDWLLENQFKKPGTVQMPSHLREEMEPHAECQCSHSQWAHYNKLRNSAIRIKQELKLDDLVNIQKEAEGDNPIICYCNAPYPCALPSALRRIDDEDDLVECAFRYCSTHYFHRGCIKKDFRPELSSKFYCADCLAAMEAIGEAVADMFPVTYEQGSRDRVTALANRYLCLSSPARFVRAYGMAGVDPMFADQWDRGFMDFVLDVQKPAGRYLKDAPQVSETVERRVTYIDGIKVEKEVKVEYNTLESEDVD